MYTYRAGESIDRGSVATAFFQNVNKVLTGTESGKDAVVQVEQVAKSIVH